MSAATFIAELAEAGIRLHRDDAELVADVLPGANVDAYRDRIQQNKPALIEELLQREIEAVVTTEPADFNRERYNQLWRQWHALHLPEMGATSASTPSTQSNLVPQELIEATQPPAGWDGALCDGCRWPAFCGVLGPRGPHLPGGPCAAWPVAAITPAAAHDDPAIAGVLAHLAEFTPQQVEEFRQEVTAAPDDDPFIAIDRTALARFDRESDPTPGVCR